MELINLLFAAGGIVLGTVVTTITLEKVNNDEKNIINKLNAKLVSEKMKNEYLMKMYQYEIKKNFREKMAEIKKSNQKNKEENDFDYYRRFPMPGDLGFGPGRKDYGMRTCFDWARPFSRPFLPALAREDLENNKEVKDNDEI